MTCVFEHACVLVWCVCGEPTRGHCGGGGEGSTVIHDVTGKYVSVYMCVCCVCVCVCVLSAHGNMILLPEQTHKQHCWGAQNMFQLVTESSCVITAFRPLLYLTFKLDLSVSPLPPHPTPPHHTNAPHLFLFVLPALPLGAERRSLRRQPRGGASLVLRRQRRQTLQRLVRVLQPANQRAATFSQSQSCSVQ